MIISYFVTAIMNQTIQCIHSITVGIDVCVRILVAWEENGVPEKSTCLLGDHVIIAHTYIIQTVNKLTNSFEYCFVNV